MSDEPITVVRLPNPGNRHDPVERVLTTVARVDLDLAEALHEGSRVRPYSVVRRRDTLDVVAFRDQIAQALLRGERDARLVVRVDRAALLETGRGPLLHLAFETPTLFRVAGLDYVLPDPFHVFGSLIERWKALDWPELPYPNLRRVAVSPSLLRFTTMPATDGQARRGFVGVVRFDLTGLEDADRQTCWTLARFGEYRGVGRNTSYGLGRVRIVRPDERWELGAVPSVWEAQRVAG